MEKGQEIKDIYSIKCNYDGHFIAHILKQNSMIKFNREFLNNGEVISVDKIDYHKTLECITTELLRRNPSEEVNWIDYNGKERPYDKFCFGVIKIKKEFADDVLMEIIKDNCTNLFNDKEDDSFVKAPINVEVDGSYLFLEGRIYYDDLSAFWHDLRYGGLNKVFLERQNYCNSIVKNNINFFESYVEAFYNNDIDGYYDESLNNLETNNDNTYIKILKNK